MLLFGLYLAYIQQDTCTHAVTIWRHHCCRITMFLIFYDRDVRYLNILWDPYLKIARVHYIQIRDRCRYHCFSYTRNRSAIFTTSNLRDNRSEEHEVFVAIFFHFRYFNESFKENLSKYICPYYFSWRKKWNPWIFVFYMMAKWWTMNFWMTTSGWKEPRYKLIKNATTLN